MFQTLKNAWKVAELRSKLLFTLLVVILYRIGANIPVPYISKEVLAGGALSTQGTIFDFVNTLSGGAFSRATLFALGVSPYITASIVIQLLSVAIPYFENLAKQGEDGKKILSRWTRGCTAVLGLVTAIGYTIYLNNAGMLGRSLNFFNGSVIVACYCAGACLVMWLAERINEFGMGNGISIILFANIVASFPAMLVNVWNFILPAGGKFNPWGIALAVFILAFMVGMMLLIVLINDSERRIPVLYAKRTVGRKQYGGQSSNLPIKMNMTGVMPIIFANAIVSIPATIIAFFKNPPAWLEIMNDILSYDSWLYVLVFTLLIIAFAFFYVMISFNPVEVANNIQQQGGQVRGIRPGRPTVEYISKVLNRITLLGALFVCAIACFPLIIYIVLGYISASAQATFSSFAFLGSSIIIVVGVALETVRELEAQMSLRNYKGFLD